jgi:hypothetical protein
MDVPCVWPDLRCVRALSRAYSLRTPICSLRMCLAFGQTYGVCAPCHERTVRARLFALCGCVLRAARLTACACTDLWMYSLRQGVCVPYHFGANHTVSARLCAVCGGCALGQTYFVCVHRLLCLRRVFLFTLAHTCDVCVLCLP